MVISILLPHAPLPVILHFRQTRWTNSLALASNPHKVTRLQEVDDGDDTSAKTRKQRFMRKSKVISQTLLRPTSYPPVLFGCVERVVVVVNSINDF